MVTETEDALSGQRIPGIEQNNSGMRWQRGSETLRLLERQVWRRQSAARWWPRVALFISALFCQHHETHGKTIKAYIQTSLREFSDIYLGQVRARSRLSVTACASAPVLTRR